MYIPHLKGRFLSQCPQTWTRRHPVSVAAGSCLATKKVSCDQPTGLKMKPHREAGGGVQPPDEPTLGPPIRWTLLWDITNSLGI